MDDVEETDVNEFPLEEVRAVLERAPVRLAILFGSYATGETHDRSDVDIAVDLEGVRPGDEGYDDAFFGLSVDLSEALETDDVDLVNVHSLSGSLARVVSDDGVVIHGDVDRSDELEAQRSADESVQRSPRERFAESTNTSYERCALRRSAGTNPRFSRHCRAESRRARGQTRVGRS